ncbi:MAG: stage II sporulation protein R [Firmicutes bacterium]|nr:stage II sporulation protein R [Bacillota bacterium]
MFLGYKLSLRNICRSVLQAVNSRVFVLEVVLVLAIFCLPAGQTGFWATLCGQAAPDAVQAGEILRFHVRAHSNDPKDQEIKNYVAHKILTRFQPVWKSCRNSSELGRLLVQTKPEIAAAARVALQEKGFDYDVAVSLTSDLFPARFYEGQLYPPGEYTALYLIIGEGCGENWWCVLFPPLCFNLLPPLTAEDTLPDRPENRQPEENAAEGLGSTADLRGENKKEKPAGGAPERQGREQRQCRFWLWEKICGLIKRPASKRVVKTEDEQVARGSAF